MIETTAAKKKRSVRARSPVKVKTREGRDGSISFEIGLDLPGKVFRRATSKKL